MPHLNFQPDLTGSDETLDELLERLRTFGKLPTPRRPRRGPEYAFTTGRPPGGVGGAEAPVPVERPLVDLYAPH